MIEYADLTAYQKKVFCRAIHTFMDSMDKIGVEIVDLTFYMDQKQTPDTQHNHNTTLEKMPVR